MKESFTPPESGENINREQVIDAYRKFSEQGIKHPDDLDLSDPKVQEANKLFDTWRAQQQAASAGDEELQQRASISNTMLYVDSGFTDPEYLDEVLSDWLVQHSADTEKQGDNPERAETRRQIADAIKKVRGILGQS